MMPSNERNRILLLQSAASADTSTAKDALVPPIPPLL